MDETSDHILHAFLFDGKGGAGVLHGDDIINKIKSNDLAWVHLDAEHPNTRTWLQKNVSYLDELAIDALLADETRPRLLDIGEGFMVILRGVNLNENADPEDMVSIRLWVDPHRIISLRKRSLKAVQDIKERLEAGTGPKNEAEFLCSLTTRLFERMVPTLNELDDEIDDAEEKIVDCPDKSMRHSINDVRRRAIILRRYIAPQRDLIMALYNSGKSWLRAEHKRHLHENWDRLSRYVEDLDMIRERALIVKDELANALNDQMNKNTYLLTLIAAIFLPLGFLTGLLGINVGGIPGSENSAAFWIFCIILAGITALQIAIFKKLKWI
jgi:zinc transporter